MSTEVEPEVHAAGGVVVRKRRGPGRREILLVHRPRYDDWTLPKGKRDPEDASDEATALREVLEETGFTCALGDEVGSTRYRDAKGRNKLVRYWMMALSDRVTGEEFIPNREVDELRWCSPSAAGRLLTYEHDRVLVESLGGTLRGRRR